MNKVPKYSSVSKIDESFSVSNETNGTDDINLMVSRIKHKMDKLKSTTNLDIIVKEKDEVNADIKKVETVLTQLKQAFDQPDSKCEIDDSFNFETCFKEIEELYVGAVSDVDTIVKQIEKYNLLKIKVKQCMEYLENKKMNVVKVD
jgi:hypothetical protein